MVAYHLTGRSTPGAALRSLVDAVVLKAHGIGLQVVNVTTDMGPSNQAMWKAYNIGCSRDSIASFCKHPVHADLKLHFMADVPHLVKNMCTALMRHKVFTINVEIAQEHNLPSNTVNVSHLIDLAQFQHDKDLKLAPNLSLDILTSSSHFKKMNVGRALHIFSKSVSAGLRYLIENEQRSTDYLCTAWFVELVDRWFDLMSSRHPVMALSPQKTSQYTDARDHLACFMKVVKTFQVGDMSSWKPIQTGVLLSTTTVLNLCDELLASRLEFLLTSRLTQDCVENLFSIVRSRHPTPTGREFKYALKLICTAQYLKPVKHSNYHMDEREFLGELLPAQIVPPLVADTELDDLQLSSTESLDDAEKNSLYYLAGYCVHSLLRCNQICTNCADSIRHSNNDEITAHPMSTLLRHKNFKEGALVEVGIDIFSSVLCWEDIVRSYETAFKARNICQRVIDVCLEKTSPPDNIPSCHSLFRKLVTKFVTVRLHIICKKKTAMQKRSTTIPHGSRSMAMRALAERL